MSKTVVGLFVDHEEAKAVVSDLENDGFSHSDVSLIASSRHYKDLPDSGAALSSRAGTGAAIGGAAGLMIGLAALAIPGIGPIVAAGPLAAALTGAGVGAATGGMLGALADLGMNTEEAGYYAEAVKRGSTLVTIHASTEDEVDQAQSILNRHGAVDIEEHAEGWKKEGWSGFDAGADVPAFGDEGSPSEYRGAAATTADTRGMATRVYQRDMSAVPDPSDAEYRRHYETTFYNHGTYNEYADAYRFGHTMGSDPRYRSADWNTIERDAQSRWEQDRPGSWSRMKDAVRHAWHHVQGRV